MKSKNRSRFFSLLKSGLVLMHLSGCATLVVSSVEEVDANPWNRFEAELESLRQQMKIPGISAAVVKNVQLIWTRGFVYADVESRIPAYLTLVRWAMARLQATFDGRFFTLLFLENCRFVGKFD